MRKNSPALAAHKRHQFLDYVIGLIESEIDKRDAEALKQNKDPKRPIFLQEDWDEHEMLESRDKRLIVHAQMMQELMPPATKTSKHALTRAELRSVGDDVLLYIAKAMVQAKHYRNNVLEDDFERLYFKVARIVEFLKWEAGLEFDSTYYEVPQKTIETDDSDHQLEQTMHITEIDHHASGGFLDSVLKPAPVHVGVGLKQES